MATVLSEGTGRAQRQTESVTSASRNRREGEPLAKVSRTKRSVHHRAVTLSVRHDQQPKQKIFSEECKSVRFFFRTVSGSDAESFVRAVGSAFHGALFVSRDATNNASDLTPHYACAHR